MAESKRATTFQDLPLAGRTRAWDAAAANKRVRSWAGADDGPNAKYRRAFFWFDPEAADTFGGYKLQFADVISGALVAVPRGVFAAAAAIQGSRGGVNIPESDVAGVKSHIGRYYAKMRREWEDDTVTPPWKSNAPEGMEFKSYPAEFKVDAEQRTVQAYVSVFGNVDDGRDVMERGVFTEELKVFGHRVKACWQHNWMNPIGRPTVIEEDSKGLYTEAVISRTQQGNEALILIQDGVVNEASIGFTTLEYRMDEDEEIRYVTRARLFEFSYVTWGMNELAQVTGVKSRDFDQMVKRLAAMQDELTAGRAIDRADLERAQAALKALLDAMPGSGNPPPSRDGADDAGDDELKALAADGHAWLGERRGEREVASLLRDLATR